MRFSIPTLSPERLRELGLAAREGRLEPASPVQRRNDDAEHREQAELIKWAQDPATLQKYPELSLLYAVPNGGFRSKATAGKLKAEGLRRGVPDLVLPVVQHPCPGLYLELKARGGYPTEEQVKWMFALRAQGYCAGWCRGAETARFVLEQYLASGSKAVELLQTAKDPLRWERVLEAPAR